MLKNSWDKFIYYFAIALFTAGIGFLFHELAHKYFAQRFGCIAEFRADFKMLLLAIGMSFFGFFFIAPGAVFIHGTITVRRNGIISLAGPATNVVIAAVFFLIAFISDGLIKGIATYGILINAWLGLFNMIPFANIDGEKILRWNKPVYALILALSIIMLLVGYFYK